MLRFVSAFLNSFVFIPGDHHCHQSPNPKKCLNKHPITNLVEIPKYAQVLCSLPDVTERVDVLLRRLEAPCPHHRVCDVFSKQDFISIRYTKILSKYM